MTSTVVVGGFFGDEGKGKIISYLAIKDNPKIIERGGAGPNAGHTIRDGDKVYKVRMLPSGFLNKNAKVMIGPGVVINPDVLKKEIEDFDVSGLCPATSYWPTPLVACQSRWPEAREVVDSCSWMADRHRAAG